MEAYDETSESQKSDISNSQSNYNFVQLSRGYLVQMRKLARKSPLAHEVLYYLVEHMGRTTNAVVCSYQTLCEVTNSSRSSIGRAIKLLKDENWIDTVSIGNAKAYCVNEKVFWQASKNQRKYAIFSATVIASETEQENDFQNKIKKKLTYVPIIDDS